MGGSGAIHGHLGCTLSFPFNLIQFPSFGLYPDAYDKIVTSTAITLSGSQFAVAKW
jgi:hypothetical protein